MLEFSDDLSVDTIFMIDGSGSLGASNFDTIKSFLVYTVSSFDIAPNKTRVGLITFG